MIIDLSIDACCHMGFNDEKAKIHWCIQPKGHSGDCRCAHGNTG